MAYRRILAVAMLGLAALLAWFDFSGLRPFRLGLDLRGGSHLVYEAETSSLPAADIKDAMSALREVIERRINAFGVAEPVIQIETVGLGADAAHRLIVELPGVTDLNEAIRLIDVTPVLEFKTERPDGPEKEAILAAYKEAETALTAGQPLPDNLLLQQDPEFIATSLTGRYLKRARVDFGQQSINPSISLEFDQTGGEIFAELTKANVNKRIGIYLDGRPLSAPVVKEEIKDGRAEITGQFTLTEARELVRNLNLGALPVAIKLVSTETVGATLGQEALARGVKAGIIGLAIVAAFMTLWYRFSGLIAVVSLAVYLVLVLAVFKLLPVTLTAAGIAGFILSLGIAVDANVLIFERLKEELRRREHLHEAIRNGFAHAWLPIRDSNLSSIISALILFWFGTSLIKGFALTLTIGIIISMFTAITVTRNLLLAVAPAHKTRLAHFLFSSGFRR
ncbi:MAG: protein translocase subunit SecD [Candidatus Vogelbacteria bacterium]|nr:protein translocase subunit SecD [Candidatus Vogelbacteria bacterium]